MDCVNKAKNTKFCSCSYPACTRKGVCCECLRYHLSQSEVPACLFPKEAEKIYDRSLKFFISLQKNK
jgi:hypothetical protein